MSPLFIGFDGFIDLLYHAVQKRLDRTTYISYPTLTEFGQSIEEASSKSCNIESVLLHSSLGGNAPLITLGLTSFNLPVHLVGCLGYPHLHSLFSPLQNKKVHLHSLGEPGITSAYEFQDGKLLLGSMNDVLNLTFEEASLRCPEIESLLAQSYFFVTVNWTMCPLVQEFWRYLAKQDIRPNSTLFVDFADPRKRSTEELLNALHLLQELSKKIRCCISLNTSESDALLSVLGGQETSSLKEKALFLSDKMPHTFFYLHTSREVLALSAKKNGQSQIEQLNVPFIEKPFRLTGAGDMFNAGLISALYEEQDIKQQLIRGLATSGIWIRKGRPATSKEIQQFESDLLSF